MAWIVSFFIKNKDWIFSGIGITIISYIINYIKYKFLEQNQTYNKNSKPAKKKNKRHLAGKITQPKIQFFDTSLNNKTTQSKMPKYYSEELIGAIFAITTGLVVAIRFFFAKTLVTTITSPEFLLLISFTTSSILFNIVGRNSNSPSNKYNNDFFILAISFFISFYSCYLAFEFINASLVKIIVATSPIFSFLILKKVRGIKFKHIDYSNFGILFISCVLVMGFHQPGTSFFNTPIHELIFGIILALIDSISFAVYAIQANKVFSSQDMSFGDRAIIMRNVFIVSSIILIPLLFIMDSKVPSLLDLQNPKNIIGFIVNGFGVFLTYLLFNESVKRISPAISDSIESFGIIIIQGFEIYFLGTNFTLIQIFGVLLLIFSIWQIGKELELLESTN
jgi:drug/metabolite transporter (DMT)-like permease